MPASVQPAVLNARAHDRWSSQPDIDVASFAAMKRGFRRVGTALASRHQACLCSPRMRLSMGAALLVLLGGCSNGPAPPVGTAVCTAMASRCGGAHPENWLEWCNGGCVPESARTIPCPENDECLLCAIDAADGGTGGSTIEYFGLPSELEYLWTQLLPHGAVESEYPPTQPQPTGTAFIDRGDGWRASSDGTDVGSWQILQPIDAEIGDPMPIFCEPGPNLYLRANVSGGDRVSMRATSLPADHSDLACPSPFCRSGPYPACGDPSTSICPYGDEAEYDGYGSASQIDRMTAPGSTAEATYGYGRYRSIFSAGGPSTGAVSGTVYAFFSQSNEPCVDGAPDTQTNTAEIDIELSGSTDGTSGALPYCDATEMCFILSTWTSSGQGLPYGVASERHQVSGFRYYDRSTSEQLRTYGYDWRETEVRFTYDSDPNDCDEALRGCAPAAASVAICEHTHFIPRRPSPVHFQLWNSWWGGFSPPGTPSEMTITSVWHHPQ